MKTIRQLKRGELLAEKKLQPVTRLDLIRYAGASGDFNPIHTIDEEAERAGLPGIIARGMWTMGAVASLFSAYYAEGFIRDYSVRFRGMVFLGDVLTVKAVLQGREGDILLFEAAAFNSRGEAVVKGEVQFALQEA